MNFKPLEPRVVRLLQNLEKHPELYKQSDQKYHTTPRILKQRAWDTIATTSGFSKTEEAKCRWRGLLIYFRQILEDVAKKKLRRYIPNTGNPDDKYVQLSDWRYYEHIKFMEPYIKISPSLPDPRSNTYHPKPQNGDSSVATTTTTTKFQQNSIEKSAQNSIEKSAQNFIEKPSCVKLEPMPSAPPPPPPPPDPHPIPGQPHGPIEDTKKKTPIQVKIGNVIVQIQVDSKTRETNVSLINQTQNQNLPATTSVTQSETGTTRRPYHNNNNAFESLSANDQNLKSFFEAMLKSAQRLPKFHQDRVKRKLLATIRHKKL